MVPLCLTNSQRRLNIHQNESQQQIIMRTMTQHHRKRNLHIGSTKYKLKFPVTNPLVLKFCRILYLFLVASRTQTNKKRNVEFDPPLENVSDILKFIYFFVVQEHEILLNNKLKIYKTFQSHSLSRWIAVSGRLLFDIPRKREKRAKMKSQMNMCSTLNWFIMNYVWFQI